MADLDDFFAKKDRKKGSKGVKKFTTTEELAKKLEETHRREKERLKEKKTLSSQNVDGDGEHGGERQDEDEWKEFEEEKKDYTNLKIQNLQISETPNAEDGEGDGESVMEENEAGEMVLRKKQPSGPWMNSQQQQQQQQQQHQQQQFQEPIREEPRPAPPPAASGEEGSGGLRSGYVPPHLRNASAYSPSPSSMHTPLSNSRFRSKAAPDITNEAYFPTLSAANSAEPSSVWGRRRDDGRGFEEVRNTRTGTATYNPRMASSGQGPNLSLGNRWDSLRDQS